MPVFCYRCPHCGHIFEEFFHNREDGSVIPCASCGLACKRLLGSGTKYAIKVGHFFEPYMEEDLGQDPVLIKSPDHFKAECEKRGLGWRKGRAKLN
jgi:putative FmdB family regulatory protein